MDKDELLARLTDQDADTVVMAVGDPDKPDAAEFYCVNCTQYVYWEPSDPTVLPWEPRHYQSRDNRGVDSDKD